MLAYARLSRDLKLSLCAFFDPEVEILVLRPDFEVYIKAGFMKVGQRNGIRLDERSSGLRILCSSR